MKRIKLFFLAVCAVIPLFVLTAAYELVSQSPQYDFEKATVTFGYNLEHIVRVSFPFGKQLVSLRNRINLSGGRREIVTQIYGLPLRQNGIFVSESSLMRNIDEPVDSYVAQNIEYITAFADEMRQHRIQTYIVLIPTSGAILQQNLPPYANSVMVNQRQFIDEAYSLISGSVTAIDAYSPLFSRRNQYIYYRTENNLTSLGGYYVYSAILPRLGLGQAQLKQFDTDYVAGTFYGDLALESGYAGVSPDTVSLFRYSPLNRRAHEFFVLHKSGAGEKVYHTLYPTHASVNGDPLDVFLGGISSITDIYASTGSGARLLLLADKTAISFAPLLANNCERLTIANLSSYNFMLDEIRLEDYDKVIFAFSTESFMQMPEPARAASFLIQNLLYE